MFIRRNTGNSPKTLPPHKTMIKHKKFITLAFQSLITLFVVLSQPLLAADSVITAINIKPIEQGDLLLISYEGELSAVLMSVNQEKRAILKLPQTSISPEFKLKKRHGTLIKSLTVNALPQSHSNIAISFKRRLGRHSKTHHSRNGKKSLEITLLDEVAEATPPPTDQSVIQAVIEPGIFELDGTKKKKPLDYNKDDRKKISTEEFLSLFGTKVVPRPNRITNINYQLTNESLTLTLSLPYSPSYTLKSRKNPPGIELIIMNTLGDIEINHSERKHDFLGNLVSVRTNNNTLKLKTVTYETIETSSKIVKNDSVAGYQLIIGIKRIYPWETEAAIPEIDIR